MQPVAEAAARHEPAGEFVDDDHLLLGRDDVVHVAPEHVVRLQGLQHVVLEGDVAGVEQVVDAKQLFAFGHALVGEGGGAGLFVHGKVGFGRKSGDDVVHAAVEAGGILRRAGDDQRRARLVDEDGVHFVHDGEIVFALHQLVRVELHVVAQVVEAEFVVGAVRDVGTIGGLALLVGQPVHDDAHGQPQEVVQAAHPRGIALGQVVVDGDDMHAKAGNGVQHHGQGGHEGLAFTGLHFGDAAFVQHHAAHQLHVEVAHVQGALARLAREREDFGQQVVQAAAVLGLFAVFGNARRKIVVGKGLHLRFQGVDGLDAGTATLDVAVVGRAEDAFEQGIEHSFSRKMQAMGTRGGDGRLPRIRPRAGRGWRWPLGRHAGRAACVALRAVSAAVPEGCRRAGLRAVHGRRAVRPHLRKRARRWGRGGLRNKN